MKTIASVSMRRSLTALSVAFLLAACGEDDNARVAPLQDAVSGLVNVVPATGELASRDTAFIGAPMMQSQRMLTLTFLATEGEAVKKGDRVAGFDTSKQRQEMQSRKVDLEAAIQKRESTRMTEDADAEQLRLQAAEAKMKLDKVTRKLEASDKLAAAIEVQKLRIEKKIAEDEVQRVQALLSHQKEAQKVRTALADANVQRLQNDVNRLQDEMRRANIRAPKEGMVVHMGKMEGNKYAVGDTVFFGESVISLPSLDNMLVKAVIPEIDARRVAVGQRAEIVLEAAPDRRFHGKIERLGQVFRPRSPTEPSVVFDAEIALEDPDPAIMRPGMAARILIQTGDAVGGGTP